MCHIYPTPKKLVGGFCVSFGECLTGAGYIAWCFFPLVERDSEMKRRESLFVGYQFLEPLMKRRLQIDTLRKPLKMSIQSIQGIEQSKIPTAVLENPPCSICQRN